MQVKKRFLARLPWVYAITTLELEGRTWCLAASELEGEGGDCLLIDPDTGAVHTVWTGPGGVMSLVPIPGEAGAFLSIDEFYPVFQSEHASVHRTALSFEGGRLRVDKTLLCRLPYTHRITLLREADGVYLAAASLCERKDFVEDWAHPGGIYIGAYDPAGVRLEPVYQGLTKHHGMYTQPCPGGDVLWLSAQEGILRVRRQSGGWNTEFVFREETSDLWLSDLDGDGKEELAVIQGFHGDTVSILKSGPGGYEKQVTIPVHFGHVVWSGQVLGSPSLITASRAGDMELTLHRVTLQEGHIQLEPQILDRGSGATQIAVVSEHSRVRIFSASHETGAVDLYELTP